MKNKLKTICIFWLFAIIGCKISKLKTDSKENPSQREVGYHSLNNGFNKAQIFCTQFSYERKDIDKSRRLVGGRSFREYIIPTKSIIKPEFLKLSVEDSEKFNKIFRMLTKGNSFVDTLKTDDSRFVILLTSHDTSDSLVFSDYSDSVLAVNNKYLYHYPFNIMDSVVEYMHLKKIICK